MLRLLETAMGKYEPLGAYLREKGDERVPMSFAEIERVVGAPLPPSAGRYSAWWSNNPTNNVMTRVWMKAGYRTENVDVGGGRLVFRRVGEGGNRPVRASEPGPGSVGPEKRPAFERLHGFLRGTVRIEDGADLTEPAGEIWSADAR